MGRIPYTLDEIVNAQLRGEPKGITSICSAHPAVLDAVFQYASQIDKSILIESTCNQVNQFGGYTGMNPVDFVAYVQDLADKANFPLEKIILGGDHLGPSVWQHEPSKIAMKKSKQLIKDYVNAGYSKIHIDASMMLGDDKGKSPPIEVISQRTAELAFEAERIYESSGREIPPRYVIGTEVPIPGGVQAIDEHLLVSEVTDTKETIQMARKAFFELGLKSAWDRVIAVVVQPGVEFGTDFVIDYNRDLASDLSKFIEDLPLIYEAHSTDYQHPQALREMVEDHFAILKVGPALTFTYREAIFGLAMIENEMFTSYERSNLVQVLDQTMARHPEHWHHHYQGNEKTLEVSRKYSFSDRSRYYWPISEVQTSVKRLMENLGSIKIPLSLLSQYLPEQYLHIRSGRIPNDPQTIIQDKLFSILDVYQMATDG